jgi:RecB family exonuclease
MTSVDILKYLKKTYVVNGVLAINSERFFIGTMRGNGASAMAIEHVAERLAGGLLKMIDMVKLRELVSAVLPDVDLGKLEPIKELPGVAQAATRSLMKFWMSGVDPKSVEHLPRMQSLFELEAAVLARMPANLKRPTDLRDMALTRAQYTSMIFGRVEIKNMTDLHPVWQPLVIAMAKNHQPGLPMVWNAGPRPVPEWVKDICEVKTSAPTGVKPTAQTSANARHEVVEALRWMRGRLAAAVDPGSLAIATTSTATYDDLFVAAAAEADIKVHFVHGVSCVHTEKGQTAAALADLLLRGLSQKRVRRLLDLVNFQVPMLASLPRDWPSALKADASLTTVERWRSALKRPKDVELSGKLMPVIELLGSGIANAADIGSRILPFDALAIWERALRDGPAEALDRTIKAIRVKDDISPLMMPCFMSAEDLAANPRAEVMLIGMTAETWPRHENEDSIIPDHVIPTEVLNPMPLSVLDEADFNTIVATTTDTLVFSWPRRGADGKKCEPSGLLTVEKVTELGRSRRAPAAMSEADRRFCRPDEFEKHPEAIKASSVIADWFKDEWTPHDGLVEPGNARIAATLEQVQSATSIRKLLRDPIGYVWQYALGFRAPEYEDEPLLLDSRQRGNLLHDILQTAVSFLEQNGGIATASKSEIGAAVKRARHIVANDTAASQPVPPEVIWQQTLNQAEQLAMKALSFEFPPLEGQKTYCEVPFGDTKDVVSDDVPMFADPTVIIPGTKLKVAGRIDRLDTSGDNSTVRVIDYKSGQTPKNVMDMVFKKGDEVQRPIYFAVIKSLMKQAIDIEAGLLYPVTGDYAPLADLETHVEELTVFINEAVDYLLGGHAVPGPATSDAFNALVFALPANASATYLQRSVMTATERLPNLSKLWSAE